MTFDEWYTFKGFKTLEDAAEALGVSISAVSRMRQPGYRANKFTAEHIKRKTGGKVSLALTERNKVRA